MENFSLVLFPICLGLLATVLAQTYRNTACSNKAGQKLKTPHFLLLLLPLLRFSGCVQVDERYTVRESGTKIYPDGLPLNDPCGPSPSLLTASQSCPDDMNHGWVLQCESAACMHIDTLLQEILFFWISKYGGDVWDLSFKTLHRLQREQSSRSGTVIDLRDLN